MPDVIDGLPPSHAEAKPWYKSKWFNLTFGLIVTLACLAYAMHVMADGRPIGEVFREIGGAFKKADYVTLLPMWGLLFVFYWLKAWRWRMLLAPLGDYRTSRLFPPTLIGFAFNNVLPAHLGEFVRVFVFARQSGLPKSAVLTTVVVERVFDVVAILFFLGLGLVFVPNLDPSVRRSAYAFAAAAGIALTGAAAYLIWPTQLVALFEWGLDRVPFLPERLKRRLCDLIETGARGLTALKSGPLLMGILGTSLLQWAINSAVIHLALWSFGFRLSPLVSCVVMGVTAVGVTVPSSPGYFGVIQLCFLVVLRLFVPPAQEPTVMAASIYYHIAQWVPVTMLGMYFFVRSGLHVAEIEEEVESEHSLEGAELGRSPDATDAHRLLGHSPSRPGTENSIVRKAGASRTEQPGDMTRRVLQPTEQDSSSLRCRDGCDTKRDQVSAAIPVETNLTKENDMARKGEMFAGLTVALVTPFKDGAIDEAALRTLVDWQVETGTECISPCGTTGESPTLTHEEHERVISIVCEQAAGRIRVMAGTGSNSTAEAIRLSRRAKEAGADGALMVAPYYNKPMQDGFYEHFKAVAQAVDIPIVLYNIPGRTAKNMEPETICRLGQIDNIVAVKESTGSMDQASQILGGSDLTVLSGDDSLTLPLLALGGSGVVSVVGNIVPQDVRALIAAWREGKIADAQKLHHKLFPLCRDMLGLATNPIPVKAAMRRLGHEVGDVRLPLTPLTEQQERLLGQTLAAYGLTS